MPRLIKNKYYTSKGEEKVCGYTISISKPIAIAVNFNDKDDLVVKTENGKIIIEKK